MRRTYETGCRVRWHGSIEVLKQRVPYGFDVSLAWVAVRSLFVAITTRQGRRR